MTPLIDILLHDGPLQKEDLLLWLGDTAHGAEVVFWGVVRNKNEGKSVAAITFDTHRTLAHQALHHIAENSISESHEKSTRIYIAHATGHLQVGDVCIAIGVSAPHRTAAYQASRFIIDQVKIKVPIWKQEHYADGTTAWLPGHELRA